MVSVYKNEVYHFLEKMTNSFHSHIAKRRFSFYNGKNGGLQSFAAAYGKEV